MMDARANEIKRQLVEFKSNHRSQISDDWHEPDIDAQVTGDHLDNAFGTTQPPGNEEFVIHLSGRHGNLSINLADLLAIAWRYDRSE